jgi:hypothetical protein
MYNRKGLAAITEAVFTDAKVEIIDPGLYQRRHFNPGFFISRSNDIYE